MLLQKVDVLSSISENPTLSISKPSYGKGFSFEDERVNIDVGIWQMIQNTISGIYQQRHSVTLASLLSSLSIESFSHRHISEL